MAELVGVVSRLDITLYDLVQLSSTNTAGTYSFFTKNFATSGKERTSLPQANLIPENWKSFTVNSIGFKVLGVVKVEDLLDFIENSYYQFKVADYEIKQGHISEFFKETLFASKVPSATSNVYEIGTFASTDEYQNLYISLMKPIVLEPMINFSFTVSVNADVAGMRGVWVAVYFKGVLDRSITG